MSKKNRERRTTDGAVESNNGGQGGGMNWLPVVLAVAALGLGFVAWTDAKKVKDESTKRIVDLETRMSQLQTQVANAAKAKPPSTGPDPNKVYTVKTDGAPTHGNPTAPIVIAEFSDYQ
jgi:protein-disulfide isomerase